MFRGVSPPIIKSSKLKIIHIPDAVCTILNFELLMMGGETPETFRALTAIKNIV
jgi:hypothetical protein